MGNKLNAKVMRSLSATLIISIISLVVSIGALGLNYYNSTYPNNTDTGKTFQYSLKAGKSSILDIAPIKGVLYMGYTQKTGLVSGMNRSIYKCYYRPATEAKWHRADKFKNGKRTTEALVLAPAKNNRTYGSYRIASVNGKDRYLFKWHKTRGTKVSTGSVDLMLD